MPGTDKAALLKQRVFEQAESAHVRFVSLQFTDIMGVVKNVHIPFHRSFCPTTTFSSKRGSGA